MCLAKKVNLMMITTTTYKNSLEYMTVLDGKIQENTTEELAEYLNTTHHLQQLTNLCTIYNVVPQYRINVETVCS